MKNLPADKPQMLLGKMWKYNAMEVILMGTPAELWFFFNTSFHQQPGNNKIQWWLWSLWMPQKVGKNSEERRARLNNLSYWVTRVQKQLSLLQTGGCLRGHKLQRGPSTWAIQTPKAMLQMGKAVAISMCKKDEQEVFSTTQGHLCIIAGMLSEPSLAPSVKLMER